MQLFAKFFVQAVFVSHELSESSVLIAKSFDLGAALSQLQLHLLAVHLPAVLGTH